MHFIGWVITETGTLDEVERVMDGFHEGEGNEHSEWDWYRFVDVNTWHDVDDFERATFALDGANTAPTLPHTIISTSGGFLGHTFLFVEGDRCELAQFANWEATAAREIASTGGKFATCINYHI